MHARRVTRRQNQGDVRGSSSVILDRTQSRRLDARSLLGKKWRESPSHTSGVRSVQRERDESRPITGWWPPFVDCGRLGLVAGVFSGRFIPVVLPVVGRHWAKTRAQTAVGHSRMSARLRTQTSLSSGSLRTFAVRDQVVIQRARGISVTSAARLEACRLLPAAEGPMASRAHSGGKASLSQFLANN